MHRSLLDADIGLFSHTAASADSQRSGSSNGTEWTEDGGGASWSYLSRDKDINGPTERLPPDVVVSDTGPFLFLAFSQMLALAICLYRSVFVCV
jgi:hypothetical protein